MYPPLKEHIQWGIRLLCFHTQTPLQNPFNQTFRQKYDKIYSIHAVRDRLSSTAHGLFLVKPVVIPNRTIYF